MNEEIHLLLQRNEHNLLLGTYSFAGCTIIINTIAVATTFCDQIEITFDQFLGQVSFHDDIRSGGAALQYLLKRKFQ